MTLAMDGAHWRFALKLYGQDGVSPACLYLQDVHGVDVNVLLIALYAGLEDRRSVGPTEIATLDTEIRQHRETLVLPLRKIRRFLKPMPFGPESEALRNIVKKAELAAEQFEQFCLAREASAFKPASGIDPEELCWHVIRYFDPEVSAMSQPQAQPCVDAIARATDRIR